MRARESDVSNVPDVSGIKFSYMRTHTYERVPVRWGFFRILKIIFFLLEYQCVTTKIADFDFSLSYLCTVIQKTGRYQARIRVHAEIPDRSQKSVRKISYRWLKADVWNENQNQNKQLVHLSTNNLSTLKKSVLWLIATKQHVARDIRDNPDMHIVCHQRLFCGSWRWKSGWKGGGLEKNFYICSE